MKKLWDIGTLLSCENRGDLGGHLTCLKTLLRAAMVHVREPWTLVIVIATPFLNGSVFEEGTVRMNCDGTAIDGMNCMLLLVM